MEAENALAVVTPCTKTRRKKAESILLQKEFLYQGD